MAAKSKKERKMEEVEFNEWRTEVVFSYEKEPLARNAQKIYTEMLRAVRQDKALLNPKVAYISDLIRHDRATLAEDENPSGFWLVDETSTFIVPDWELKGKPSLFLPNLLNNYPGQAFRYSEGSLVKVDFDCHADVKALFNN